MKIHLLLIISLFISTEIVFRFNLFYLFKHILSLIGKTIETFKSNVNDQIKEKNILENSKNLFIVSIKSSLFLFIIILIFYICILIDDNFLKHISSFLGIAETIIIVLCHVKIRKLLSEKL